MRKLGLLCLALAFLSGAVSAKITLPVPTEFKLDNGLTIQVVERHQLPLFSLKLTVRGGSTYDPVGKEGLASLASDMLMRGTRTRDAKQIADEIAFGGGTLGNSCSYVTAGFDGEFLTAQGEAAFEILSDLVLNSTFTEAELDKTRKRASGDLQNRRENPGAVANDRIRSAILGGSRYAHFTGGEIAAVKALTRDDVVQFVEDHYTPDNCVLVVCGDLATETVRQWAVEYFGRWNGQAALTDVNTPFPTVTGREVTIYDKKDATQTQIRIGGNGMPLNHPDYPALEAARTVYGGSFTSRLMDEIRVNRGLTYGVRYRSYTYSPGGVAFVTTFTKHSTVGEVIDIILAEAANMQTEPVSDSELTGGINYQCGTYPLDFETNDDLAGVFANLWVTGLDKSYYEDYQEKLKAVTAEQVIGVAKKYFPQDNYKLVLVGKADEIMSQAEKYGPVTVIPLSEE